MILFCLIILSHSCWVCGSNPDLSLNSRLVNTVAYSALMCRYPKGSSANVCRMELWAPHLPQACPSEETVTSSTQLLKPDTPTAILSVTFSLARHIQATSSKLCHPFSKCVAPGRGHRVAQSRGLCSGCCVLPPTLTATALGTGQGRRVGPPTACQPCDQICSLLSSGHPACPPLHGRSPPALRPLRPRKPASPLASAAPPPRSVFPTC